MIRAALYIRVSTEEQKIHGLSLEAQKEALQKYAKENHFSIVDYYIDAGLTARKRLSHRKELLRLLEDVRQKKIDLILFTKLDRWFRNIGDYYKVQDILEQNQVHWKTIFENYDTSTANGRLHINIMLSIAQDEADRTSERIKAVFDNKRARGETPANKAPLGYKIEHSRLLIDETTRAIAQDIFAHYDLTHSITSCVRLAREKYNYNIYEYSIRRMLSNPTYIGSHKNIPGFNAAIIPTDLFQRIQSHRTAREYKAQQTEGRTYLFSTLLICKECGHRMTGRFVKQMHKAGPFEYHYYGCMEAIRQKTCPHRKQQNELQLETYLLDYLATLLEHKVFTIETKPHKPTPVSTLEKLNKKLRRLKDLYLEDCISIEDYKEEYTAIKEKIQALSYKQEQEGKALGGVSFLEMDIRAVYHILTPTERKQFWLGVLNKVEIDKEGNFYIFLR